MKSFNYYILVALAAFGATLAGGNTQMPDVDFKLMGLAHLCIVVVFWMIDSRSNRIAKISQTALKEIESCPAFAGKPTMLLTDEVRNKTGFRRVLSYTWAYRLFFVAHLTFAATVTFGHGHLWPTLYDQKHLTKGEPKHPKGTKPQ